MPAKKPLVTVDGQIQQLPDSDFVQLNKLNLGDNELVTAATTITVSNSFIRLQNLGPGNQDVETILGGDEGDILVIRRTGDDDVTIVKGAPGNIRGGPDRLLSSRRDVITLVRDRGSNWLELSWQG